MPADLSTLESLIARARTRDQRALRDRLAGAQSRTARGQPADRALDAVAAYAERSAAEADRRRAALPRPTFPDDLPIAQKRDELARTIEANQVVVVCGATGSGKTTQIPKICLSLGRGARGMIAHTQPRRIAARALASRIAEELGVPLGAGVGYKIRFTDRTSPDTFVKVMTDGVLLAETQSDRYFEEYDTIIIDEAHERGLNIDFLLGWIHRVLPRRPDLRLIITSATIDPQRFADHFGGAPVIEVSGRTYPVEIRHRALLAEEAGGEDLPLEDAVAGALFELAALDTLGAEGDVLVFMPGEREIRDCADAIRDKFLPHHPQTEILPLYARLPAAAQHRVFEPHRGRRIVIATNVAETSLTVPGVRYVVDSGLARLSRYSARTKVERLPIEAISRASADQRAGRCGRTSPGVCIRLYAEADYEQREAFTPPEVLRSNLAGVVLRMKALRLGDIDGFPFLDPPDPRMIKDGVDTLIELGALTEAGELTKIGRDLARLPVDPRIGRMILAGEHEGCLAEVVIIAAALSVQDPRESPPDQRDAAATAQEPFRDEHSDFLSLLKLWEFDHAQRGRLSRSQLRKWRQRTFLSDTRMREWEDIHHQLHALAQEMGLKVRSRREDEDSIHRAMLAGLLSNVGRLGEQNEYEGARGLRFFIFPGSALFKTRPKWLMAGELVKTTRLYARDVARIQPQWVETVGAHLVKREHSDPHWDDEAQRVSAWEKVSLYGLPIVPRRLVHFGPVDPPASRALFIHHALVESAMRIRPPFLQHNLALVARLEEQEAKRRKRDLLADASARFAFYDTRLPADAYSVSALERWRREAEGADPRILFMAESDLLRPEAAQESRRPPDPDSVRSGEAVLPLTYRYEFGAEHDGVTMTVPVELLDQIDEARCEWLSPSLLPEKITELIRALPKNLRTALVPAPQVAARVAAALNFGEGRLLDAVAAEIERQAGVAIPADAWRTDGLPAHLRMNLRVVGEQGAELAQGRDAADLRRRLRRQIDDGVARLAADALSRDGATDWEFGDLPEHIDVPRSGVTVRIYPALLDMGATVSLRGMPSADGAARATRAGLRRLYALRLRKDFRHNIERLPGVEGLRLLWATLGKSGDLHDALDCLIADLTFLAERAPVRTKKEFRARLDEGWNRFGAVASDVIRLVDDILSRRQQAVLALESLRESVPGAPGARRDVQEQIERLFAPGFLVTTPVEWLAQFPRYMETVALRLRKLSAGGAAREEKGRAQVAPLAQRIAARLDRAAADGEPPDVPLHNCRWLLEELRVSLFAQELGTAVPVSAKRIEQEWALVRS